MKKVAFTLVSLVFALVSVSMAEDTPPAPATPPAAPVVAAPVVAPTPPMPDGNVFFMDKTGRHFVDPVCGMLGTVADKTPYTDFKGMRYYVCSDDCNKKFTAGPADYIAKLALPSHILSMADNKVTANCVVSDEKVVVTDKTPFRDYQGHRYYFCCNKCPKKFDKNPAKYADAGSAPAQTDQPTKPSGEKPMDMKHHM